MGGRPWTEQELSIIMDRSISRKEAAELVNRSVRAIENARKKAKHGGSNLMQPHHWAKNPYFVGKRRLLAKTCPACGLLIDARFYTSNGKGTLKDICRWCIRERQQIYRSGRKPSASSKKYPPVKTTWPTPRRGMLWVGRDYDVAADPSKTIKEKAQELGRSYSALAHRCGEEKFKSMPDAYHGGRGAGQWQIQFSTNEQETA